MTTNYDARRAERRDAVAQWNEAFNRRAALVCTRDAQLAKLNAELARLDKRIAVLDEAAAELTDSRCRRCGKKWNEHSFCD